MKIVMLFFFFFKQKTAYEMRISDWSSDVCSSDLFGSLRHARYVARIHRRAEGFAQEQDGPAVLRHPDLLQCLLLARSGPLDQTRACARRDRKSTRLNSSH